MDELRIIYEFGYHNSELLSVRKIHDAHIADDVNNDEVIKVSISVPDASKDKAIVYYHIAGEDIDIIEACNKYRSTIIIYSTRQITQNEYKTH